MLSTLMNYRLYAADMTKSLARISSQPSVQRDIDYYKANIGKVKTPDDLLKDQRLYAYAMKAYGLEDQIQSKGMMRKVLESDLSNTSSYANKLADKRYRDFASSFQFGSAKATIQTTAQTETMTEGYSKYRLLEGMRAKTVVDDYKTRSQAVFSAITDPHGTDVAEVIVNDTTLFSVIAKVAMLDPATTSKAEIKAAITGSSATSHPGLALLRDMFNLQADGKLKSSASALQDPSQLLDFSATYFDSKGVGATSQAAALKTSYFVDKIASVQTISDITEDPQLFSYVLTAFGIDPAVESSAFVRNVLDDQDGGPSRTLDSMPTTTDMEIARKAKFEALNAAFDFNDSGNVRSGAAGDVFRNGMTAQKVEDSFNASYETAVLTTERQQTSVMAARLSNMKTINDLVGLDNSFGKAAFNYILKAFDIDPATESSSKIRRVLLSDTSDPSSFVNKLDDPRYERLAAAFNFGSDGKAATQRLVQSTSDQTSTGSLYAASFGKDVDESKKDLIKAATKTYLTEIASIRTLDDFVSDKSVVKYALQAYGLGSETISDRDLRRILTSDLADPKSFANAKGDKRYVKLASAFNFETDGTVRRDVAGVQSGSKLLSTQNQYLLQTMEKQAGEQSEGARLALYFLRKAPDVTGPYGILADKALFEVVRTALSLPASMASLDIERQAKILESKINFKDFQDVKKLDKFISRFSSLYDMANGGAAATSPVLALFGGSAGSNGLLSLI